MTSDIYNIFSSLSVGCNLKRRHIPAALLCSAWWRTDEEHKYTNCSNLSPSPSVVARAGLGPSGVSLMCRHGAGEEGGGHSWHCRVISTDTATDIRRAKTSQSKDHHYDCQTKICRLLPTASQLTFWPSLSLLMRLAFSTLGEILTNIFDTSY